MNTRRSFLKQLTALPVLSVPACAGPAGDAPAATAALDAERVRALAEVLLPSELGEAGIASAVSQFIEWVAAYRPTVERDHGYGSGDIDYTSPHPGPGWVAQLDALDAEAHERHGSSWAALGRDARTGMVRAMLARESGSSLPAPADAHTVALGFLAWFYDTPAANDLCFGAAIQRGSCRPLAAVTAQPASRES